MIIGCVVAVAVVFALTNAVVMLTTRGKIVDISEAETFQADYIVVLGASVFADGTPSGVLQDRLDDGIALYFAGAAPMILMSGDGGDGGNANDAADPGGFGTAFEDKGTYDEIAVMRDYALSKGVPASAIVCDEKGYSTYESMYRARYEFDAERVIVATQTYHLYRALFAGAGLGMDVIGVPSDYRDYENQLRFDVREIPARTKDFFQTIFRVTPGE